MTRHQYGISALVSQTSFGGETSNSVAKCRLFSQAISGYTDVSPVAPTPFGFLLLLLLFFCVLYYKFILYISRGAPHKAVKKITITPGKCQLYI